MKKNPCVQCGACCVSFRVSFHWSETLTESFQVPAELTEKISPHLMVLKGTNQVPPKCIALEGKIGHSVSCRIYKYRPSCCRNFRASYEDGQKEPRCDEARVAKGLAPLTVCDWERVDLEELL